VIVVEPVVPARAAAPLAWMAVGTLFRERFSTMRLFAVAGEEVEE